MTAEDRLLLLCARQDFTPQHQEAAAAICRAETTGTTGAIRWDCLLSTAERHGVLPIVGWNLQRCGAPLPAAVAGRLELAIFENAAVKERDADRLAAGLAALREVGLEALLLKGTALDLLVYDEPWVAVSKDIDLSLRPSGPGWGRGKGREKEVRRALYTHGVECDLDGHHDLTLNGLLPLDFGRIWREARPLSFRGQPAWVMSPEDLLVSLCVNACRKRFFRLKGLFDVAETIRRGGPFAVARLAAITREGRCGGVVYAALAAARGTLGAELPAEMALETMAALGISRPRAGLLRLLVTAFRRCGSFAGRSGRLFGLALVAAGLRPADLVRFFVYGVTRRPKRPFIPPAPPAPAAARPAP
ncbi:MAG: nucleotidyltransferase family protein [Acidobacteria bacterium]|nr:nucleotidyltransferase family protein [Geodermatophilales bacterium]MBW8875430.1 nucleotidyltransferase family protein [Acidobacteriota bacterium]